ncbi:MAG: replication initiator protein [Microvirus sp.]|nr:MAG: replication initiator protein [Microvirus sp.]
MPCYHPIIAYRSRKGPSANGAWPLVFNSNLGYCDMKVEVPCGKCIGCRMEYSRQWAIRALCEMQMHKSNSYITLTYNKNPVSLNKRDYQLFIKKMRRRYAGFRYMLCGEYGERMGRPHYHACMFGVDFPDRKRLYRSNGFNVYGSSELENIWGNGFVTVGDLSFQSAAYVARYIVKKIDGDNSDAHYKGKEKEFLRCSQGIGRDWFLCYAEDAINVDKIVQKTLQASVPKYYNQMYKRFAKDEYLKNKEERREKYKGNKSEYSYERLAVKETLQVLKLKLLKRSFERN